MTTRNLQWHDFFIWGIAAKRQLYLNKSWKYLNLGHRNVQAYKGISGNYDGGLSTEPTFEL